MSRRRLPSFAGRNGIRPEDHDKLVMFWARRYGAREPVRDSEQYSLGWVGLLHAADRFDPSIGCTFSTYATWWIKQAITRPHFVSLAAKHGGGRQPLCFSQMGQEDSKRSAGNELAVDREPGTVEKVIDRNETNLAESLAAELLRNLGERDERIVRRYVMMEKTLEEVGAMEGVTRERIRQIVCRSLLKMQRVAQRAGLADRIETMELLER